MLPKKLHIKELDAFHKRMDEVSTQLDTIRREHGDNITEYSGEIKEKAYKLSTEYYQLTKLWRFRNFSILIVAVRAREIETVKTLKYGKIDTFEPKNRKKTEFFFQYGQNHLQCRPYAGKCGVHYL